MLNLHDYDRVVSQVYEAALVPAHWDIALTSLIDLFAPPEWHIAFVVWERLEPAAGRFIGSAGVHPLALDAYAKHFAGRQEWSIRGHQLKSGQVVLTDDLIALDADRSRRDIAWRYGLGPEVTEDGRRLTEIRNWIEHRVKPEAAARGRG